MKKLYVTDADASPEFLEELRAEAAAIKASGSSGLGYSTEPEDSIWGGLDSDWLSTHLGRVHPLENVLRRIILEHPISREGDKPDSQSEVEHRLQKALFFLVRRAPISGRPIRNMEVLFEIARQWWREDCASDTAPNLTKIIRTHVHISADQDDRSVINDWIKRFNHHKDFLMKVVTGANSDEQLRRKKLEQIAIEALRELMKVQEKPSGIPPV